MGDHSYVSGHQHAVAARALLAISGGLILFLGGTLLLIGRVLLVDRSNYCTLAGCGLILAGDLIAKRRREGAWVFIAVFAITLIWSLGNLQAGGTSLAMRLVGPTLLLSMIGLLMPTLRGWRTKRTITTFSTLLAGTIGLGIFSGSGGPLARPATALAQVLVN